MARLTGSNRGAAWVFADFRFRERLRERLGFAADGKHCVRLRCSNTGGRRTELIRFSRRAHTERRS